tara:strand:- start:167 stop:832 length:666 start_codon:yes stop_codon:yes gene_type:complete
MAVYKHKETGNRFLFIHIPRTGGRFIEVNLENNGWEVELIEHMGIPHYQHSFIDDCEIAHFHRDLYEKYCDMEGIPQIAVVRDPVDKFFSASIYLAQVYGRSVSKVIEDENKLKELLDNFPYPETINWWRPQVDFITEKTHVWKYEDGLDHKFSEWVTNILGLPFKVDAFAKYPTSNFEGVSKLDRSDRIIDNVRKLWREDYEQLYPELDSPFQKGEEEKT